MVQSIRKFFEIDEIAEGLSVEGSCFIIGQDLIDHGTILLKAAIDFQTIGLIFLKPMQLDHQSTFVVELHPDFRRACEDFDRPDIAPSRENSEDSFKRPYGELECFKNLPKDIFKAFDYIGEEIYLLSEERLQTEIASRDDHRWLLFRTPYRPTKVIETELLMETVTNSEVNPATMIRAMIDAQSGEANK